MPYPFKNIRLGAAVVAVAVILVSGSPNTAAFAQVTPPSATTSVALSEPTIKALQDALNKQGITVKADGVLSDETRAAIRKYQTQHHLPVTGEPDKATLDKLGVATRQSAAPDGQAPQGQAAGTTGAGSQMMGPQMMMQGGMMPGGMMNCPMMPGQAQSGASGMMQSPMQPGQMQPGQMPQGGMMMNGQMMQGMMQMMQGMMQMMQTQMQGQTPSGQPGQMQPGQMPPTTR